MVVMDAVNPIETPQRASDLLLVKGLLAEEPNPTTGMAGDYQHNLRNVAVSSTTPGKCRLQFTGWCIMLSDDGTWVFEDTTGG